jgi:hypothetical protein
MLKQPSKPRVVPAGLFPDDPAPVQSPAWPNLVATRYIGITVLNAFIHPLSLKDFAGGMGFASSRSAKR